MHDRAQSESIGVILLVGVVVISVATVGAFVLSDISSDSVDADISVQIATNGFYFSHEGGDPLPMNELLIVVRSESGTSRPKFTANTIYEGDDDEIFEPGERWANVASEFDGGAPVTVSLFETRTNSLLVKETAYPQAFYASGPTPPIPLISIDRDPAYAEDPTTFDSAGSEDPDGEIVSYTWVFEDGSTTSGETATRTYSNPGTYNVTLSLEDDVGLLGNTTRSLTVLPANPQVENVVVSSAPLNASDVTQTQTITVRFDREMNTATNPTVELRNLTGTVTYGTGSWTNNSTFVQQVDIADADEESLGRVNVTGGADETASVTEPNNNTTVFVDTREPTISGYSVTNPSGSTVQVNFTSSEELDSVLVRITDKQGTIDVQYTKSDFVVTETGGSFTYSATYDAPTRDDYTAALETAKDEIGNEGAGGETGTVTTQTGSGKPLVQNFSAIVASSDRDLVTVGNVTVENVVSGEDLSSIVIEVRETGNTTVIGNNSLTFPTKSDRVSQENVEINAPIVNGTSYNITVVATSTNGQQSTQSVTVTGEETLVAGSPTIDAFSGITYTKNTDIVTVETLNASDDTQITTINISVIDEVDGVVGSKELTINSNTANLSAETVSVPKNQFGNGETFTVRVVVTDNDGNTVSQTRTGTA